LPLFLSIVYGPKEICLSSKAQIIYSNELNFFVFLSYDTRFPMSNPSFLAIREYSKQPVPAYKKPDYY